MPFRCVVYGCSNTPSKDISLHKIPYYNDDRPEAKRRRKEWVDFVKLKRASWTATANSRICSAHFEEDAFSTRYPDITTISFVPRLKTDDIGICARPTIHPVLKQIQPSPAQLDRKLRFVSTKYMVIEYFFLFIYIVYKRLHL